MFLVAAFCVVGVRVMGFLPVARAFRVEDGSVKDDESATGVSSLPNVDILVATPLLLLSVLRKRKNQLSRWVCMPSCSRLMPVHTDGT